MKKLWLALSVGTGVGAIVAGSVLLAVYITKDNTSRIPTVLASQNEKAIRVNLEKIGDLEISEIPGVNEADNKKMLMQYIDPSADPTLPRQSTAWEKLIDKMNRRLNAGPESGMLKRIILQRGIPNSDDLNGFYVGQTNEIYINTDSLYETLKSQGFIVEPLIPSLSGELSINRLVTYEQFTELLAEMAFQVIYHEYGHHMAYVYLNSDNSRDNVAPLALANWRTSGENARKSTSRWNQNFVDAFIQTLGYDSTQKTAATYFYTYKNTDEKNGTDVKYANKKIYPLHSAYSLSDLFGAANPVGDSIIEYNDVLPGYGEKFFGIYGKDSGYIKRESNGWFASSAPISKSDLMYYYSMDELYTRKMLQATMPLDTVSGYGLHADGFITTTGGRYYSDFISDTNKYADGIESLNNPSTYAPYYEDYLYGQKELSAQKKWVINSAKAQGIYQAMLGVMGYSNRSDISVIWWKNDAEFNVDNETAPTPSRTNFIKFGGYIDQEHENMRYVGYYTDAAKTKFVSLPIIVDEFNFKVKTELAASRGVDIDYTKYDKYYYILRDYVNINDIAEKELYFSSDAIGTDVYKMTAYNSLTSTDLDDYRGYTFTNRTVVPTSTSTGGVKIKLLA